MEFTEQDLRLIKAMCITSNPWFPDRPMIDAWKSIYDKADAALSKRTCPDMCSHPDCG